MAFKGSVYHTRKVRGEGYHGLGSRIISTLILSLKHNKYSISHRYISTHNTQITGQPQISTIYRSNIALFYYTGRLVLEICTCAAKAEPNGFHPLNSLVSLYNVRWKFDALIYTCIQIHQDIHTRDHDLRCNENDHYISSVCIPIRNLRYQERLTNPLQFLAVAVTQLVLQHSEQVTDDIQSLRQ